MSNMQTPIKGSERRENTIAHRLEGAQKPCPYCGSMVRILSHTKLREIRKELGLSLREVARRADISAAYVSDVELGRRGLSIKLADKLLRAMGV